MKPIPNKKRNFRGNFQISLLYSAAIGGTPLKTSQSVSFECRRTALQEHKFQIGQTVYFTSRPIGHMVANSTYQVVKLLPSDGADYQYRIKNANEAFERVARESQLEFSR
jgi:hypothetical protein